MAVNFNENEYIIGTADYRRNFWNAMRREPCNYDVLDKAEETPSSEHLLPLQDASTMDTVIERESVLRSICTAVKFYSGASHILAHDCTDIAEWVPEGAEIPVYDALNDFTKYPVESYKLAVFVKLSENFVHDASFNVQDYLTRRLAKNFAKAEDNAFITGDGENKPTGLLHSEKGAEIGATTESLSFDDLVRLYSSVKPEYRRKGTWLMNDDTALALRTMKDSSGAYIWNSDKDTILEKPVVIAEGMPNVAEGNLPVLFGDFSYYWIIRRSPVRLQSLKEKFVLYNQIGYLATEFMDGRLIRRDAVKALKVTV